jgi:hypothetical protein
MTDKIGHFNGHITLGYLRDILDYDMDTGLFWWKDRDDLPKRCRQAINNGAPAGCLNKHTGYIYVGIAGKTYLASRLAYFYVTGYWPQEIDHKNRNPADNRWDNLRDAVRSTNMGNTARYSNNTSGFKGAYFVKGKKRWKAMICINRKNIHLGYFDTAELAHEAYCYAAKRERGEFARFS